MNGGVPANANKTIINEFLYKENDVGSLKLDKLTSDFVLVKNSKLKNR